MRKIFFTVGIHNIANIHKLEDLRCNFIVDNSSLEMNDLLLISLKMSTCFPLKLLRTNPMSSKCMLNLIVLFYTQNNSCMLAKK